jgi:hypothetical protein
MQMEWRVIRANLEEKIRCVLEENELEDELRMKDKELLSAQRENEVSRAIQKNLQENEATNKRKDTR